MRKNELLKRNLNIKNTNINVTLPPRNQAKKTRTLFLILYRVIADHDI